MWMPWLFAAASALALEVRAQVWINEILVNPPNTDPPNEYVELRGTPNYVLSNGTYFVAVEGELTGNPGTIQNVFDLSRRALGGNGFLVLLQNSNIYALHTNCAALINTNGPGFGTNGVGPPRHRGEGNQTDLENQSSTFFLIQSTNFPTLGMDIDADNDGLPDGPLFASWNILDSVGVLASAGIVDIAYGKINFRRTNAPGGGGTVLSGTVVPVAFNPAYVARTTNSVNWQPGSWVASGTILGAAPDFSLDLTDTEPKSFGGKPLNHIGGPNFGAASVPGVVARESGFSTDLVEGLLTLDSYTLGLNTAPAGNVTIRISAGTQLQISTDGGATFGANRSLTFNSTAPQTVLVRVLTDNTVDASPHTATITHTITNTADAANYPLNSPVAVVNVNVTERDTVLLSELKVNPPLEDSPYEFVELRGPPNALLTNIYFLALEGNNNLNPGSATVVMDLSGERLGASGLLLILADGHPYSVPGGTRVFLAPQLNRIGGGLGNGSITFMLVSSQVPVNEGADLDAGDNGTAEGLPVGLTVMDSVAWLDGGNNDRVYSPALLTQPSGTPDAATRLPGNNSANSTSAWVFGNLEGVDGSTLAYANEPTVPYGTQLTPGSVNNSAPKIAGPAAFSSVIADPTTPSIAIQISDAETPVGSLSIDVSSDNQAVVPDDHLLFTGGGGSWTLVINPIGVGYATVLVTASDGNMIGLLPIQYAASADPRGNGRFHTGVSDASTAVAIDSQFMLVGDDENQVLRIFSRSNSGPAIVQFDLNPFLGLMDFYDDGTPREIDLEGSTRVGDRLYWIGSHSHSRDFDVRTNRARLFATQLSAAGTNSTLTFLGHYDLLKLDLMAWDAANGHGRGSNYLGLTDSGAPGVDPKAPDGSGFNIEGLAMAPGSTNIAFVCFRAPLVPATNRVKALLVPVTNFATLATTNITNAGAARFGAPIELNLGGRGVRSIEGNAGGYLIVAGPPGAVASGVPPDDFRFFTWNGLANNAPQERSTGLQHMIPEGIVELPPAPWTSNSPVQILSDNGITVYYGDTIEAKQLPHKAHKKFRSDWLALGAVVPSAPVIKSVRRSGGNCVVTWYSIAGTTYRLQSKAALSDPTWVNLPGTVTATDALMSATLPMGGLQKFFRVIVP